jgi:hypothetical protein
MSRWRAASLAAVVSLVLLGALTGPASATSCIGIEDQLKDLPPGTAVFIGTVIARDAATAQVRVDQWFSGDDPREALIIPLAGPGDPIVVGAWEPAPGQTWFIIGDRIGPDRIDSSVCRQTPADANILSAATARYGTPRLPPYGQPDGTAGSDGPPLPIVLGLVALGVVGGLGAVVLLQRRLSGPSEPAA